MFPLFADETSVAGDISLGTTAHPKCCAALRSHFSKPPGRSPLRRTAAFVARSQRSERPDDMGMLSRGDMTDIRWMKKSCSG